MRVNSSRLTVGTVAAPARLLGARVSWLAGEGRTACTAPVEVHMFGYPDKLLAAEGIEPDRPISQLCYVRCRKCPECLRHRARIWTARAMDETRVSTRTWFGTLTLAPDRQAWARYSALSALERGGWKAGEPDDETVFVKSVEIISHEITRFLKRVRKTARFRYMLVTEQHKSGLPHFHCLVHEYRSAISKRLLEAQWRYGFSHWRLIPPGNEQMCGYVAKYLAKSALTRVRASADYGRRGSVRALTERVNEATRFVDDAIAEARTGNPPPVPSGSPEGCLSVPLGSELQD